MSTYLGAFAMLVLSALAVLLLYLLARRSASASAPAPLTALPFLSGWPPREHALSRYHARWYPLTVLFLAFDVEMLLMYPWAVVVARGSKIRSRRPHHTITGRITGTWITTWTWLLPVSR